MKITLEYSLKLNPGLNPDPKIEVSYENNTSEVYYHLKVWKRFEEFLRGNGIC
jgi:hypothetical protein